MPPKTASKSPSKKTKPARKRTPEARAAAVEKRYGNSSLPAVLKLRDSLLAKASSEEQKKEIHEACKGLFPCGKTQAESARNACLDEHIKKLTKVGKAYKLM